MRDLDSCFRYRCQVAKDQTRAGYRNIRYTLDRGNPLQVPCSSLWLVLTYGSTVFAVLRNTNHVVEAAGMW
jgi:hypothetical protein